MPLNFEKPSMVSSIKETIVAPTAAPATPAANGPKAEYK